MIWCAGPARMSVSTEGAAIVLPKCCKMDLGQHDLQWCGMSMLGVCTGVNLCVPVTAACLRNVGLET